MQNNKEPTPTMTKIQRENWLMGILVELLSAQEGENYIYTPIPEDDDTDDKTA